MTLRTRTRPGSDRSECSAATGKSRSRFRDRSKLLHEQKLFLIQKFLGEKLIFFLPGRNERIEIETSTGAERGGDVVVPGSSVVALLLVASPCLSSSPDLAILYLILKRK